MKDYKTYAFDKNTQKVIDDIRNKLNLDRSEKVLSRAITLLKLAADEASKGGVVTVGGKEVEL